MSFQKYIQQKPQKTPVSSIFYELSYSNSLNNSSKQASNAVKKTTLKKSYFFSQENEEKEEAPEEKEERLQKKEKCPQLNSKARTDTEDKAISGTIYQAFDEIDYIEDRRSVIEAFIHGTTILKEVQKYQFLQNTAFTKKLNSCLIQFYRKLRNVTKMPGEQISFRKINWAKVARLLRSYQYWMSQQQSSFYLKLLNVAYFNTNLALNKEEVRQFVLMIEKMSGVKNPDKNQQPDNKKTEKKKKSQLQRTNRKIIERGIIDEKSREIALLYVNFKSYPQIMSTLSEEVPEIKWSTELIEETIKRILKNQMKKNVESQRGQQESSRYPSLAFFDQEYYSFIDGMEDEKLKLALLFGHILGKLLTASALKKLIQLLILFESSSNPHQ